MWAALMTSQLLAEDDLERALDVAAGSDERLTRHVLVGDAHLTQLLQVALSTYTQSYMLTQRD